MGGRTYENANVFICAAAAVLPLPCCRCHAAAAVLPLSRCRCHAAAAVLPLSRCRCRAAAVTLPLPCCRCHAAAAVLPLPCCRCHAAAENGKGLARFPRQAFPPPPLNEFLPVVLLRYGRGFELLPAVIRCLPSCHFQRFQDGQGRA